MLTMKNTGFNSGETLTFGPHTCELFETSYIGWFCFLKLANVAQTTFSLLPIDLKRGDCMVSQSCVFLLASLLAAQQLVRKHLGKFGPDEPYTCLSLVILIGRSKNVV